MTGETDLDVLLRSLDPILHPELLVWCTGVDAPPDVAAFARVEEGEGTTVVVERAEADRRGWPYETPSRRIELLVHSSLDAVGLTAAIATALAAEGISANVVAAFHHDHVLVPEADADRALATLRGLGDLEPRL